LAASSPTALVGARPNAATKWHLDEVVITIAGKKHWLWRAVDQEGFVLDVLVQSRRDKKAAKRLLRKLLKTRLGHLIPAN
jgi:putative transposase